MMAALNAVVLVRFAPHWPALRAGLADPYRWVDRVGPDAVCVAVSQALLWLAACWLGVALLLSALACMPGELGRLAGAVSWRMQPKLLQRLIVTAAGASIACSPIAATASTPTPAPAGSIVVTLPTDSGPSVPDPIYSPPIQASPLQLPLTPSAPPIQAVLHQANTTTVTVKPEDSLWKITADRLGSAAPPARIAAAWPQLYAANRNVIGQDPALLHPGQTLVTPAFIQAQP